MALSPNMERTFWQEVHKIEEVEKMRYVMSIERMARQDGDERAHHRGVDEAALVVADVHLAEPGQVRPKLVCDIGKSGGPTHRLNESAERLRIELSVRSDERPGKPHQHQLRPSREPF